jgi:PAS domain S-box-containing protein
VRPEAPSSAPDGAPELLWVGEPDGSRSWFSERWLELTGRDAAAAAGDGWLDGVHPEDAPRCRAEIAAAARAGRSFTIEYRIVGRDGEHRVVRDRATLRRGPDGEPVGYVGACVDLTAQRAAAAETSRRGRQQELVAELGRAALEADDDRALLDLGVELAAEGLDVPLAAVLERHDDVLAMVTGTGWDLARLGGRALPPNAHSLAGFTLAQDAAVVSAEVRSDGRFEYTDVLRAHGVASAVNVVIRAPDRPLGVLGAYTTAVRRFSEDDVLFLRNLANVLGAALARARVERELRERELEARLAFSAGHMGSWRWDPATDVVHWSPEMEAVYGLAPGGFPGTFEAYVALVHPDDRAALVETLTAARQGEDGFAIQHRVLRADGSVRTLEGRGRPVRDATGNVVQWIGVGIDVTDLAEAEAELRERDLGTRLAFGAGRMGSWRWNAATHRGTWSPELEALVGIPPDTFDGSWDSFIGPILAEDGPMLRDSIGKAVAARCEFAVQYRVRRTGGGLRWVETRGAPIEGGSEWIGVTIDVTEERAALDALHESRAALEESVARLDSLFEHAPVGFAFFDRSLRFVRVNPPLAEMHGLPVEAHLGRTIADVLPALWRAVQPVLEAVLATGEAQTDLDVSGPVSARPGLERHWLVSYYPVPGPDGAAVGIGAVAVDITERKRREREVRLAGEANALLARGEADLAATLQHAADLVVPELADSCVVSLVPHPDVPRLGAVAHVDPELAARMRDAEARWPLDVDGLLGGGAEEGGHPTGALLVPHVTPAMWSLASDDEEYLQLATDHAARSVILAPMRVGSKLVGALTLVTTPASERVFHEEDVPFVEELAGRLALAIENSYLAQEARAAQGRLDVLADIGELLMIDLDSHARLAAFADVVVPTFADVCPIYLTEGGVLRLAAFAAADPDLGHEVEDHPAWREPTVDDATPVARAFRGVAPVLQATVSAAEVDAWLPDDEARRIARKVGVRSQLFVPLVGADGPFGVVGFGYSSSGRRYAPRDVALGVEIARRMAPALENALRFEREAATAEALQRSLLPERLPELGGTRLAARYVPSGEGVRIGGDWYDAIPLADGRVVLAIGDVVGHGVRAAASMGRLRSVLQFCALDGLDPAATLERLNAYLAALADADMATLLVVEYDPADERLRYANAGHPPALLVTPDGRSEFLADTHGMPLGANDRARYSVAEASMAPGSLLVLYTDGLVERRGESLDDGMARLVTVAARQPEELEQFADGLLAGLLHHDRSTDDDVAVLLLRTLAAGDRLDLRLEAAPRELARLRRLLADWLRRGGADEEEVAELTIAVNEVAANAIEHAYGLVDAEFLLRGRTEGGIVEVEVRDFGRWRRRTPRGDRGRGLQLARTLVDELEVVPGSSGTKVTLRRRLAPGGQDGAPDAPDRVAPAPRAEPTR